MSHTTPDGPPGSAGASRSPVTRPGILPPAVPPTAPPAAPTDAREPRPHRRRPPLWLLVLAAVVVIGLVVTAVLLLGRGSPEPEAQPEPVTPTVTLPAPTPTVQPVARDAGTAFSSALPSTVLSYALTEIAEHPPLRAAGAVEAYRLVYTDGAATVVLVAGQWATPEAAATAYQSLVAAQTAADPAAQVQENAVTAAGAEVGRYTLVPRADGTGTLTWTNGTVVLQLDGPADALLDLHTAFPL